MLVLGDGEKLSNHAFVGMHMYLQESPVLVDEPVQMPLGLLHDGLGGQVGGQCAGSHRLLVHAQPRLQFLHLHLPPHLHQG